MHWPVSIRLIRQSESPSPGHGSRKYIPLVTEDTEVPRDGEPPDAPQDPFSKSIKITVQIKRVLAVVPFAACLALLAPSMQKGGNRLSKLSPAREYNVSYNAIRSITLNSLQSGPVSFESKVVDPNSLHLCSAVLGAGAVTEFDMFLSSLQKHRASVFHAAALSLISDYVFHCVTDVGSQVLLTDVLNRHGFESYELHILDEASILKELEAMKVKLSNGYGIAAVSKSFAYDIFANVSRCILLDTDIFAARPLVDLYVQMGSFDSEEVVGATWRPQMPWGDRINTGVVLQDFEKMRERGWAEAMGDVFDSLRIGGSDLENEHMVLRWADQDLMHAALMRLGNETNPNAKPRGLHAMDHGWNMEMCRHFYDGCNHSFIGILHFNCGLSEDAWWTTAPYQSQKPVVEPCVQGLP